MKLLVCVLKTASELIDASADIDKLLLAGEERVALGADIYTNLSALRRTGHKGFSASADDLRFNIIGMDRFFHYSNKYIAHKNDPQDFACLTVFSECTILLSHGYLKSFLLYHKNEQIAIGS